MILRQQAANEIAGRFRARSDQIFPSLLGAWPSRNIHTSIMDTNLTPVKIKDRTIRQQPLEPRRPSQGKLSFGIALAQPPIKTGYPGIMQQYIHQVPRGSPPSRTQGHPIALLKVHGHLGIGIRIGKGSVFLERLFQVSERKAGVDRKEGSSRACRHQGETLLAATLPEPVSQNLQ
jgi:hypothetical protein